RPAASVFLVGLGVLARRASDGTVARARTDVVAGVPGSRSRSSGPDQRCDVADSRAACDLWPQANCPGQPRLAASPLHRARRDPRSRIPTPPTNALQSTHRSSTLPGTLVQRVARHLHASYVRCVRYLRIYGAVPATGARAVALAG